MYVCVCILYLNYKYFFGFLVDIFNINCTKSIQNRKLQLMNVHSQLQLIKYMYNCTCIWNDYMYSMYIYLYIVHVYVHVYKNVYSRLHVHVCANSILITTNEVYFYQLHRYLLEQNTFIC